MDKVNLLEIHAAGGYGSEFEYDSEVEASKARRQDLVSVKKKSSEKVPSKEEVTTEYSKEEWKRQRIHLLTLDAYSRHKKFVNDYLLYYSGSRQEFKRDTSKDRTDFDIIRENHQFLWDVEEEETVQTWEKRLAKKYYDRLFKEYAITDLSRYKENKVALRWRIEKEVASGKGQFSCGNKKCDEKEGLRSWEVNFAYIEQDEKKNALVKLRLCPDCSYKLNYHHKKQEIKAKRRLEQDDTVSKRHKDKHVSKDEREMTNTGSTSSLNPVLNKESISDSTKDKPENIWSGPAKISEDKSQEEEFDDYFEDMFM